MAHYAVILGHSNSGKSTLFNSLTKKKISSVSSSDSASQDYITQQIAIKDRQITITDTPNNLKNNIGNIVDSAQVVLFTVDSSKNTYDHDIKIIKKYNLREKKTYLLLTKCNEQAKNNSKAIINRYKKYGLTETVFHDSRRLSPINELLYQHASIQLLDTNAMPVYFVGRPNVGKSTLFNKMLGYRRSAISSTPHTTIDTVSEHLKKHIKLFDTAGVSKKSRVVDGKSLVFIVLTSEMIEISRVELSLITKFKKARIAIIINKMDLNKTPTTFKIDRYFPKVPIFKISAKKNRGIGPLRKYILSNIEEKKMPTTHQLNKLLREIVASKPPPIKRNKQPKLKYIYCKNSYTVCIHGTNTSLLSQTYKNYIKNNIQHLLQVPKHQLEVTYLSSKKVI